jgi:integrative and conjugative element protein (TIGR02256 family)
MDTVYLSDNAYRDVVLETAEHPTIETGGILIGEVVNGAWYVVEVLDPGPRSIRSAAYFEYNHTYATHLANKVARRYQSRLRLLGLWHRHPGSLDTFSSTDDETHREYLRLLQGSFISMLVNIDPDFRMTFYRVDGGSRVPRYSRVEFQIGDKRFPPALLQRKDASEVAVSLHRRSYRDQLPQRRPPETMPMPAGQPPMSAVDEVMALDYQQQPPPVRQPQTQPAPQPQPQSDPNRPGVMKKVWNALTGGIAPRVVDDAPQYAAYQGEEQEQAHPRRKASVEQRNLLDMMEQEFDFLDANNNFFQYHVSPQEPGFRLEVSLVRTQGRLPFPPFVEFLFYYRGDVPVVAIDSYERPYKPGVVQAFYKQFEPQQPPSTARNVPAPQTQRAVPSPDRQQPPAQEPRHDGPPSSSDRPRQ